MAPVKPSCCNPFGNAKHVKVKSQTGVQIISDEDRNRGVRLLPSFDWSSATHLCLNCRTKLKKEEKDKAKGLEKSKDNKGKRMLETAGLLINLHESKKSKTKISAGAEPTSPAVAGPSSATQSSSNERVSPPLSSQSEPSAGPLYPILPVDEELELHVPSAPPPEDDINEDVSGQNSKEITPTGSAAVSQPSSKISSHSSSLASEQGSLVSSVTSVEVQDNLNKTLEAADISPARPSDKLRRNILTSKYERLKQSVKKSIQDFSKGEVDPSPEVSRKRPCIFCKSLLRELAQKFKTCTNKLDKYKILTSIPKRFTISEVMEATNCSAYEAREASKLKHEKGAYSYLPPRTGRSLPQTTIDLVTEFYKKQENSRISARSDDCVKIRNEDGVKEDIAKRRILHSLNDLYFDFKNSYPDVQISISKFALLRPKNCVWPGRFHYHNVCVCETHQNFQFMMDALGIETKLEDFLKELVCGNDDCYLGLCAECPKFEVLENAFKDLDEDDEISYLQWVRTDSTEIKTLTVSTIEFKQLFKDSIPKVVEHEFITHQQNAYIHKLKHQTTKEEAAITITVDFAQNYTFVVQNAVQGFHWTNSQATVHPFVVHWWDLESDSLKFKTYCVISDILTHDANTFHIFRSEVMKLIKEDFKDVAVSKVYYISDGAGSQYKNTKNMANLMNHKSDYDLDAEWVFTSTSHGKSTCDAISAVVKCHTRRASLKGKIITTPLAMYLHCKDNLTTSKLKFVHVKKIEMTAEFQQAQEDRYKNYESLNGIRKHHLFQPMDRKIRMCRTANTNTYTDFDFQNPEVNEFGENNLEIGKFYAVYAGHNSQIGMLVEIEEELGEATFQMMKSKRRNNVLSWPDPNIYMDVAFRQIICQISDPQIDSRCQFGDDFIFAGDDLNLIKRSLKMYRQRLLSA